MIVASVEVTCFHVILGFLMFLLYLLLHQIYYQIKLRRERKVPNTLHQFENIPGLHTIRTPSHTFFCGAQNYRQSSKNPQIYSQDRLKVQRLLRKLLENPQIHVPENTVAVCIPTWCSVTGARFHEFQCTPPAPYCPCPTILSEFHYTYKMVSARVQATFYHNRRCTCLAGICIYLRIPNEPWYFGDLPDELIFDLIGPGVKRFISPRGRRRHSPLLLPPVPSAPEMTSSSEEELEPDDVATPEDPPAYATVFGYTRTDLISRIDEIPPPNYYSLFVNSSKL
ncbi:CX domain-containing protein [Caenorhabditis elegans]|uniref:CX domain-containing protein n=1 Tax=Caenorhabditis elegans TaxID=6239 RepID=O45765_CAEEL|nr:CX domain-containing protein [Caenorhabditis elegans]CAB04716.1 CX domain-containing protein [Caenorhabditis elegans]|eukprot:NP_493192.1 Uncharacterized protein CELE_T07D10.1 [Caenorhabditis elegans]